MRGDTSELGDAGREPGKSYLFFLTACEAWSGLPQGGSHAKKLSLESHYAEIGLHGWESTPLSGGVRCLFDGP